MIGLAVLFRQVAPCRVQIELAFLDGNARLELGERRAIGHELTREFLQLLLSERLYLRPCTGRPAKHLLLLSVLLLMLLVAVDLLLVLLIRAEQLLALLVVRR